MSLYREQRDTALQRVAELEQTILEQRAEIQERDAELALLRRELGKTAEARAKNEKEKVPHASWVVAACFALGSLAAMGSYAFTKPVRAVAQHSAQAGVQGPFAAYVHPKTDLDPMKTRTWPSDEAAIRRYLEPKVRAGQGTIPEMKMLIEICAHAGDRACQEQTRTALDAARAQAR